MVTVKILRNAHQELWVTCNNCRSEMTIESSDWIVGVFRFIYDKEERLYINCPVCDAYIFEDS